MVKIVVTFILDREAFAQFQTTKNNKRATDVTRQTAKGGMILILLLIDTGHHAGGLQVADDDGITPEAAVLGLMAPIDLDFDQRLWRTPTGLGMYVKNYY
ncbi:MAG: hypothetical protein Q4G68_07800 [Planctomycetia bacterium]|nr:hypothetical protein [Planctomycetia bacterium]